MHHTKILQHNERTNQHKQKHTLFSFQGRHINYRILAEQSLDKGYNKTDSEKEKASNHLVVSFFLGTQTALQFNIYLP
jgi:hypothetical protein